MAGFFSLFLNPWFMVAGAALISAPIIIHLINRMRFRRLRWAAMEFLLKSQKRNRRRLIIEQLILLALRCLLILLAGLLVARYITAAADAAITEHLIVIDDTLSLTDHYREQNFQTAFDVSKQAVREIAKKHSQANSAQMLKVVLLSEPNSVLFEARLSSETLNELDRKLADLKPSALHIKPGVALDRATAIFNEGAAPGNRVLHFVSDFRKRDWEGTDSAELAKKLDALSSSTVEVRLVDTAHPPRGENKQVKSEHDNLAITKLQPESRVVVQDVGVRFTVDLFNFGSRDLDNVRVVIKSRPWLPAAKEGDAAAAVGEPAEGRPGDETERADASFTIHKGVPPGHSSHSFKVPFNQTGYLQVTATLEQGELDLPGDNIRYAVIEVRPQVPLLIIDGDYPRPGPGDGPPKGSGTVFLRGVFEAARGYRLESGTREDLASGFHTERIEGKEVKRSLEEYPCIFLVNVPDLKLEKQEQTDKAVKNLDKYVRGGGGLAFFCGDRTDPIYFNLLHQCTSPDPDKKLYTELFKDRGGRGIFPVPLPDRATHPLEKEVAEARLIDFQPKVFVRDYDHPMFKGIEKDTKNYLDFYFRVLLMRQYWPVPRVRWNKTPDMEELMTLPNDKLVGGYVRDAQELLDALPLKNEKFAEYVPGLERHIAIIRTGLTPGVGFKNLYELEQAIKDLLTDKGDPEKKDPKRPNLETFWALEGNPALRARFEEFREQVQFGDPLVVSSRYGKGRVVAWLTTAGEKWNNWPSGEGIGKSFPPLMIELQKFLGSPEDIAGSIVGEPIHFHLDDARYEPRLHGYHMPEYPTGDQAAQKDMRLESRGEVTGKVAGNEIQISFTDTKKPGTYCFLLYPKGAPDAKVEPERRAYTFNVDAEQEGDLKRASREAMDFGKKDSSDPKRRDIIFEKIEDIEGRKLARQSDWSQGPWLYLIILGVLVAEQAMAVHLSFHLKGNEAQLPQVGKSLQAPGA